MRGQTGVRRGRHTEDLRDRAARESANCLGSDTLTARPETWQRGISALVPADMKRYEPQLPLERDRQTPHVQARKTVVDATEERMSIRFENPPINELVIATYFNPVQFSVQNEHVGVFWSKIRNEFPKVRQQQPVGSLTALGLTGPNPDVFPMPRFWFISEDDTHLIQLQKNAFMFNWRRRETDYPQYAGRLKPDFDRYYNVFEEFVREETGISELKVEESELTYVNLIKPGAYWSGPRDTRAVLPFIQIPEFVAAADKNVAFQNTFNHVLEDDLHLRITVRSGDTAENPGSPVLIFELSARGPAQDPGKAAIDKWFDRAHEAITRCLLEITSDEVRTNHWRHLGPEQ